MKPLLEFRQGGPPVVALPAATVILLREADGGFEVFCVERSGKSSFLAGALVFPGGRLDPGDHAWAAAAGLPADDAFALAAIRETLEEAGILLAGPKNLGETDRPTADEIETLRARLLAGGDLRTLLDDAALSPAVAALVPFSRWITPEAETKRFDTAFFLAKAPPGQPGAHDRTETVASFWATPAEILQRWQRDEIAMVPPTHATLEWLAARSGVAEILNDAATLAHAPICPELSTEDGAPALLLGGTHPYAPRYVLESGRFTPRR